MNQYIEGNTGKWEIVIGCEVHVQTNSKSKLFSGSPTKFGSSPNSQVSFFDVAMPGTLPVLNKDSLVKAIKTGLSLNAKINKRSVFDRKHYFYPDLSQGYQISQFYHPIVGEGEVEIKLENGDEKKIGIERIHLEQDAGKSIHDLDPQKSYIDFNRAGVTLMEIVTKPDLRSAEETAVFIRKLRLILRYINVSDADMEKGHLRCDANISVRKIGDKKLGTRCEIKNLNSVKYIMQAITYEAQRQVKLLENNQAIKQETRLFDINSKTTKHMRYKEEAEDYRYFPDPDLLPIEITQDYINNIKKTLPELPDEKRKKYVEKNIPLSDANVIVNDMNIANYFDEVLENHEPKLAINWVTVELFARLNQVNKTILESPVIASSLVELLDLIKDGTISGKIAKEVLDIMFATGKNAKIIIEEKGLKQISNINEIEQIIDQIILDNQPQYTAYKDGKTKLFGFFVGQVMKITKGQANPKIVNQILKEKLDK